MTNKKQNAKANNSQVATVTAKSDNTFTSMNEGQIKAYITETINMYNTVRGRLHSAASLAIHHAQQTGGAQLLNVLFEGLRINDQTALRVWFGKVATVNTVLADGEEADICWLLYKKDTGFNVKKGSEGYRKDAKSWDATLEMAPFYDKDVSDRTEPSLAAILNYLAGIQKTLEKKQLALPEGQVIPVAISNAIASLESVVTIEKARLN